MPLFDGDLENRPVDPSGGFAKQHNHFFLAQKLEGFDPGSATGDTRWAGFSLEQRVSCHQVTLPFAQGTTWTDTPRASTRTCRTSPSLSFVTPRTARLRLAARPQERHEESSLMLDGEPPTDDSWEATDDGTSVEYAGRFGTIATERDPFHCEFRDASGKLLTRSQHSSDSRSELTSLPVPLSFVRRSSDLRRHLAATLSLAPVPSALSRAILSARTLRHCQRVRRPAPRGRSRAKRPGQITSV